MRHNIFIVEFHHLLKDKKYTRHCWIMYVGGWVSTSYSDRRNGRKDYLLEEIPFVYIGADGTVEWVIKMEDQCANLFMQTDIAIFQRSILRLFVQTGHKQRSCRQMNLK